MGVDRFRHVSRWDHPFGPQEQDDLLDRLESGEVLLFEGLRFALTRQSRVCSPRAFPMGTPRMSR